ncbi:hypothetical protein A7J71_17940 [Achromobacter insolitus]|uniref:hypothetical protein n=1 Tax=Achromobacter insolitus TaxID=217204 RepID=UPI0007C67B1A|nr:hypothetical protein [Achromobacter insolitus]OAE52852.1 hypothetical protein A7J71_17940 [Achromobacter insolitus]OCZ50663.1 hypothetical protein A7P22_15400 [Achromobacter insolitus]
MASIEKPPRPTITDEMVIEAARKEYPDPGEAEAIAEHFHRHMDGYELAKELDRSSWWDCSREDVDKLDNVSAEVERLLVDAERAWCIAYDIQPSLPIGTRLRLPRGGVGEITGIASDHSPASYLVKDENHDDKVSGNRRYIIRFEDAVVDATPSRG